MKKNVSLSIPQPCAESWSNFTPTSEGGFCGSCQKTVVDFRRMSDYEILAYIEKKRDAHLCGRFRSSQLKTYTLPQVGSIRPGFMLLRAGVLGLLLLLVSRPASAKNVDPVTSRAGTPVVTVVREDHVIKGIVRDETGQPFPGATITRKGTTQQTITDAEGYFVFPAKLNAGDVLVVNFLGYKPLEYQIPQNVPDMIEISLTEEYIEIMGELVSTGPYEEAPDAQTPVAPRR